MATQREYRTCDVCGEEWPLSRKAARKADDDSEYFCETCCKVDEFFAFTEGRFGGTFFGE